MLYLPERFGECRCVSSGLSLEIVGRLLGQTTPAATRRHAHLADDPLRAATDQFGSKIAAFPKEDDLRKDCPPARCDA
jgi:hypothetical protein